MFLILSSSKCMEASLSACRSTLLLFKAFFVDWCNPNLILSLWDVRDDWKHLDGVLVKEVGTISCVCVGGHDDESALGIIIVMAVLLFCIKQISFLGSCV